MHIHPGGDKIIFVNAGIDMSIDYNHIGHQKRPQIEGQLHQYKKGTLKLPDFKEATDKEKYNKCRKLLEAVVEMQNTLINNTTFRNSKGKDSKSNEDPNLWREVYGVFVDGSLASYRNPGEGNKGSLNYVIGPLLASVFAEFGLPLENLNSIYQALITNASTCATQIRQNSVGALTSTKLDNIRQVFESVLTITLEFVRDLQKIAIEILQDMETGQGKKIADKLSSILPLMRHYSFKIGHISKAMASPALETTEHYMESSGCMFAPAVSARRETGVTRFGLMAYHQLAANDDLGGVAPACVIL